MYPDSASSSNVSDGTFPGNDFSNNIFTDLAPLLTLFGDQMTKQFLSMSMGWADNALIAICPIGILTVMVSAIRIAGASRLKTLIGRARESRATAELELLSATSGEVCEMWSGTEIVRVTGQSSTVPYILDKRATPWEVIKLTEALGKGIYLGSNRRSNEVDRDINPNLTINVQDAITSSWQLLAIVIVGLCIQLTAFALSAIIAYKWSWKAGSNMLSSYGFPCYIGGTIILTLSLLGCARVIQNSSKIEELCPEQRQAEYQPFYVQKACTLDDKHFPPFAIFHPEVRPFVQVSTSNVRDYSLLTSLSTGGALLGYVCQFVGLRAMHWSVALIQLVATLVMTCARAFVRRGLANQPTCYPLPMGTDAAGLAYLFSGISSWELSTLSENKSDGDVSQGDLMTSFLAFKTTQVHSNPSDSLIMLAKALEKNVPYAYRTKALAQQLVNTILATMKLYSRFQSEGIIEGDAFDRGEHCWEIQPLLRAMKGENDPVPKTTSLYSSINPRETEESRPAQEVATLTADPETLSAILSLWLAVLTRRYPMNSADIRSNGETVRQPHYYRIVGNDSVPEGVPQGKAIGEYLDPDTTLHSLSLAPEERQRLGAPIFGAPFSSRHLRPKAAQDQYRIPFDEIVPNVRDPNTLPLSGPDVSWTWAMRMLGQRDYMNPRHPDEDDDDFTFLRGFTLQEQRTALRRIFHDGSSDFSAQVAVSSSSSLERNCALELYTLFMLSLTGRMSRISNQDSQRKNLRNYVISKMADLVVESTLAEDEAEALTLVVPAFAARGLLRKEP